MMKSLFRELYRLATHYYIRTGETVILHQGNTTWTATVTRVDMWAVCIGVGYIRRDLIKRDESGQWYYKYDC